MHVYSSVVCYHGNRLGINHDGYNIIVLTEYQDFIEVDIM